MRAATTWVVLAAALLGWVAPHVLTYVCSMDGRARSQCCCVARSEASSEHRNAALERADCCEVQEDVIAAANLPAPERVLLAAQTAPEVVLASFGGGSRDQLRAHPPRGPPRGLGPPPYLRCCVLLI